MESDSKYQQALALRNQGEAERNVPNREAAVQYYNKAVELLRCEPDARRLAHTIRHLGDVLCEAGRPGEAEPCYLEALELYRASGEAGLDLANAIRSLAVLRQAQAAALWAEARDLYAAAGVQAGVDEADMSGRVFPG